MSGECDKCNEHTLDCECDINGQMETMNETKAAFLDFFTCILLDFDHEELKDLTLMEMKDYVDAWVNENFSEDDEEDGI